MTPQALMYDLLIDGIRYRAKVRWKWKGSFATRCKAAWVSFRYPHGLASAALELYAREMVIERANSLNRFNTEWNKHMATPPPVPTFNATAAASQIHPAPTEFTPAEVAGTPILRYFHYDHLPEHLKAASKPFADIVRRIIDTTPNNAERAVALRKLLEAKDAAVRALVG